MPNWTHPVLRSDVESAHETSGIHKAEEIDERAPLPGRSSEAEVPANLRKPNPKSRLGQEATLKMTKR